MQSTSAIKVIAKPGHLPEFWDRHAVFFANLLALFFSNEAETEKLAQEVGEIDSYGGRLIPILNLIFRGGNSLIVSRLKEEGFSQAVIKSQVGASGIGMMKVSTSDEIEVSSYFEICDRYIEGRLELRIKN